MGKSKQDIQRIIASDPRFANVNVNEALANYLDATQARNETSLPEVTITATKKKKERTGTKPRISTQNKVFQDTPENRVVLNSVIADKINQRKAEQLANTSPQNLKVRRNLEEADARTNAQTFTGTNVLEDVVTPIANLYMPSQWVGAAFDKAQGKRGFWESLGRGNSGFVSDKFAEEHPYWSMGINALGDGVSYWGIDKGVNAVRNATKDIYLGKNVFNDPTAFTRGIGRGTEGLEDLARTGLVRGNPRGTEVTAKGFAKLWRKNRNNFRDIILSTKIPNIENKFFSRTLTEKEFNTIKEVSKGYTKKGFKSENGNLTIIEEIADPLSKYATYDDYIKAIQSDVANVERMPSRIASGEVKVNLDENGMPTRRPIDERFGQNSDYVSDGTPLSYYYDDGRNPFTKGHDYAGSNYAVKVSNPEDYRPFMHEAHQHPSLQYAPKLTDSNVEVFKRLPLGFVKRINKDRLLDGSYFQKGIRIGNNKYSLSYTPQGTMSMGGLGELSGVKINKTPIGQWKLEQLPGYHIKSTMTGSPLEKQLSKNGTLSLKQLQTYVGRNDVSVIDKELLGRVLQNHAGDTHIDYNALRQEVQGMIPQYNIKFDPDPTFTHDPLYTYGMIANQNNPMLGFNKVNQMTYKDQSFKEWMYSDPSLPKARTFVFESPGIKGNTKHYDGNPIGHSRTYTTAEEPDVLHVMESQSDWAQNFNKLSPKANNKLLSGGYESRKAKLEASIAAYEDLLRKGVRDDGTPFMEWEKRDMIDILNNYNRKLEDLNQLYQQETSQMLPYMSKSYLNRQLQENLRYAAENGQTKMRYPTPETAAKIEGYQKQKVIPEKTQKFKDFEDQIEMLRDELQMYREDASYELGIKDLDEVDEYLFSNDSHYLELYNKLTQLENNKELYLKNLPEFDYLSEHQTVLKKYADFPKQYQKLFGKKAQIRTITDAKGNTWYEVDVPENYLNGTAEMLFKKGGKLKLIPRVKSGIHIKKKNKGKFTKSAKQAGQSVQEHAKSVLSNPNATPLQKKRANFACNATKWNKK